MQPQLQKISDLCIEIGIDSEPLLGPLNRLSEDEDINPQSYKDIFEVANQIANQAVALAEKAIEEMRVEFDEQGYKRGFEEGKSEGAAASIKEMQQAAAQEAKDA